MKGKTLKQKWNKKNYMSSNTKKRSYKSRMSDITQKTMMVRKLTKKHEKY